MPTGLPVFASKLWELFELCELEGNQRAARDPAWAALLARVRVGKHTKEDEKVLTSLVLTKASKRKPAPSAIHLQRKPGRSPRTQAGWNPCSCLPKVPK